MKCDTVRDLLPLYADGLTSETSKMEVKKHLEKCEECRKYYREMMSELSDVVPKSEIDDASFIRKVHKKRRIVKGAIAGIISLLCITIGIVMWFWWPSHVKYQDVDLSYERIGNTVYVGLSPKKGTDITFSGTVEELKDESGNNIGTRSYLKVISSTRSLERKQTGNSSQWEAELENDNQVYEWVFEFEDQIIIIRNGELASSTKK